MTVQSITFNTALGKIIVTFEDGSSKEYSNRSTYLADFPDREKDCVAMGW